MSRLKAVSAVLLLMLTITFATPPSAYATAVTASRANDADDLANGAAFDNLGAWTLTVADGATFTNGVITTVGNGGANAGTLTFTGDSTLNTAASANVAGVTANRLLAINAGATGKTVTLNGDSFATTFTVTGTGTVNADAISGTTLNYAADGTLSLDTGENITAAITNTTTNNGTLTLEGAHTLTGDIGSTGAGLKLITAGNGAVVTTGDIKATTLNYAGDNSLTLATTKSITGAITTSTNNTGTLIMTNVGTVTGTVGSSSAALKLITLSGAGAKAVTGNLYATTTNFGSTGTLTMSDDASINGLITTAVGGQGALTFSGTSTVTGAIGTNTEYLGTITANGASETLTLGGNTFADIFTQGAANTIDIGANTLDLDGAATGAFTLNATGTLRLRINSATVFGNVDVNNAGGGAVTMAAGNTVNVTVAGAISNGQTFLVIDGTSGIAAVAGTITDNSALVSFTASEPAAGDLLLTATVNTAPIAAGNNAEAFNSALAGATSGGALSTDLNSAVGQILSASTADLANAAAATLDPVVDAGVPNVSNEIVTGHVETIVARMEEVSLQQKQNNNSNNQQQSGVSSGEEAGTNIWFKGYGSSLDQDRRDNVDGYDATTGGALLGFDELYWDNMRMGFGGGWGMADIDADANADQTDINTYQGSIYARYTPEPWYLDTSFTFAWNEYDGTRHISLDGVSVNRIATADYSGQQYSGFVGFGYPIKDEQWGPGFTVTPLASLHYIHTEIDDYIEEGAGALNLNVSSQGYDFLQSGLGAKLSWTFDQDWGKLIPAVHAKYLYDFIGDEAQTTSSFTGGGATFNTRGFDPAQHSFNVGAGLDIVNQSNVSIHLNYDFEGKEDFTGHYGSATVKFRY